MNNEGASGRMRRPVVVLANSMAASTPEGSCLALKEAKRAVFVVSATTGSTGPVCQIRLPGGAAFLYDVAARNLQMGAASRPNGVLLDVEVEPTTQGIIVGRDEVIEKSVEVLKKLDTR